MLVKCDQPLLRRIVERASPRFYERVYIPLMTRRDDRTYRPLIDAYIEKTLAQKPFPLFKKIEIETVNRCNNVCSFCPVNKHVDTRTYRVMDENLFGSIIEQLRELDYSGEVSLFSNNEPLLDDRLVDLHRIARKALPNAQLTIYTNGTLLTVEKFEALMENLDKMVIDNYHDKLQLIKPVRKVYEHCSRNGLYRDRVVIYVRRLNEYMTSRAGQAQNRTPVRTPRSSCVLPFSQMIVRPDGKLSLCCNDALGEMTLGDLTKETIREAWENDAYGSVRHSLRDQGRKGLRLCRGCDVIKCFVGDKVQESDVLPGDRGKNEPDLGASG